MLAHPSRPLLLVATVCLALATARAADVSNANDPSSLRRNNSVLELAQGRRSDEPPSQRQDRDRDSDSNDHGPGDRSFGGPGFVPGLLPSMLPMLPGNAPPPQPAPGNPGQQIIPGVSETAPCDDCRELWERVLKLMAQIGEDDKTLNDLEQQKANLEAELQNLQLNQAKAASNQDYYTTTIALTKQQIDHKNEQIQGLQKIIAEQRAFLADQIAQLKKCLAEHCPPSSAETVSPPPPPPGGPPPTQPVTPNPPQPVAPPPPAKTTETGDCPQRGKGCAALVVDYGRWVKGETDLAKTKLRLEQACGEVIYVAPEFKPVPQKVMREVEYVDANGNKKTKETYTYPAEYPDEAHYAAAKKAARDHNEQQVKEIKDAQDAHHKRLREGAELAIEIINGHGDSEGDATNRCGTVGPSEGEKNFSIVRADFHAANYKAAKGNVCDWVVIDFSCYAGFTPDAVDHLNNAGKPLCKKPSGDDRSLHAGYEADIAMASSTSKAQCRQISQWVEMWGVESLLDEERQHYRPDFRQLVRGLRDYSVKFPSRYSDFGYQHGGPYTRHGYGDFLD